jgi:hypothetical protein
LRSKKGALGKATPKGSAKLILNISHPHCPPSNFFAPQKRVHPLPLPNTNATFLHRKKESFSITLENHDAIFLHRKKEFIMPLE